MRTTRTLTVHGGEEVLSPWGGVLSPGGVYLVQGVYLVPGVYLVQGVGGVSAQRGGVSTQWVSAGGLCLGGCLQRGCLLGGGGGCTM